MASEPRTDTMPGMSLFLVLDGPDASGTSTHAALLAQRLRKEGYEVVLTSEPTDGPVGKQIREFLKTQASLPADRPDPMELQLLFTQDRSWHVEHVIAPALKAGKTVICDRYWHSTIVYAQAQGLDATELKKLNNKFIQPDVVIFTLPPLSVSLERMGQRSEREFFEREDLQRTIHEGYARMAKENPSIRVIDTSASKEEVAEEIWKSVQPKIGSSP